jgi:SAM-dependent methyltransferase
MSTPGPLQKLMRALHEPIYQSRLRALVEVIRPHLREGDRILDVGCGYGVLAGALRDDPDTPADLQVRGVEAAPREGAAIPVDQADGTSFPYEDDSWDVVIVADVLHHERNPDDLLAECARVCRRTLVIKDHQRAGPLAHWRISLIDWAANAPYGVPCLFRYNTPSEWDDIRRRHSLRLIEQRRSMNLYPPLVNFLFGRRLQYFAACAPEPSQTPRSRDPAPAAR